MKAPHLRIKAALARKGYTVKQVAFIGNSPENRGWEVKVAELPSNIIETTSERVLAEIEQLPKIS